MLRIPESVPIRKRDLSRAPVPHRSRAPLWRRYFASEVERDAFAAVVGTDYPERAFEDRAEEERAIAEEQLFRAALWAGLPESEIASYFPRLYGRHRAKFDRVRAREASGRAALAEAERMAARYERAKVLAAHGEQRVTTFKASPLEERMVREAARHLGIAPPRVQLFRESDPWAEGNDTFPVNIRGLADTETEVVYIRAGQSWEDTLEVAVHECHHIAEHGQGRAPDEAATAAFTRDYVARRVAA